MDSTIYLSAQATIIAAEAKHFAGLSVSTWVSIAALVITALVAVGNYGFTERRHKNDVVRNAIIDLTTGKVADARDMLSEWAVNARNVRKDQVPKYRAYYFELCWAYQRGITARSVWRANWLAKVARFLFGKPHGRTSLQFHLQQIAVSAHLYHDHLGEKDNVSIGDSDIWKEVGEAMRNDVREFGILTPDFIESYDDYFASRGERGGRSWQ